MSSVTKSFYPNARTCSTFTSFHLSIDGFETTLSSLFIFIRFDNTLLVIVYCLRHETVVFRFEVL